MSCFRYLNNGPHHRVSGHFALGQHAVERLNQTRLNTNEFFINQNSLQPPQQQLADASISTPQYAINMQNKLPSNTKLFPINNQPFNNRQQHLQEQPIQFLPKVPIYKNHHHKHSMPMIFQHPQQIPLIYEYHQQNAPQVNYFHHHQQQLQQPTPQEVIYHQQPIVSMADFQTNPSFLPTAIPFADHSSRSVEQLQEPSNVNQISQEILPQKEHEGNLFLQTSPTDNVVTPNQEAAKIQDDIQKAQEEQFNAPIVVDEGNAENDDTIIVQQKNRELKVFTENYHHQPQINVKILTDAKQAAAVTIEAQKIINGHTNNNNYQYLVDNDQDLIDSQIESRKEAPSRQFLRNFKKFNSIEQSTTVRTIETTESNLDGKCCDEDKVKVTSQVPISNSYLPPVQAGLSLTNEKLDDCIDGHPIDKIVEVRKNVNVKQSFVTTTRKVPTYGDRIVFSTPPTPINQPTVFVSEQPKIVITKQQQQQPIYISTPPTIVTKIVDRPVYIQSPPEVIEKVVHHPQQKEKAIFIERIIKHPVEVEKIVDRPVYIQSPPETKIVEQPVIVEKPVYIEKIVDRPVEKIIEKPVWKTIEKFIDRPIVQTVEKIVEKPVYVEKIVEKPVFQTVEKPVIQTVEKFVDRPVPYAVPFEKHVYHNKPDFHIIAKAVPHKHHKLFDFDALLGFLTNKQEVKHIYVPANPQYQLNQFNKHQLQYATIEPSKEALDYSRYATSHLNPIKPVYGLPGTFLQPINSAYSLPDPYAGNFGNYAAHSGWALDSVPAQSQQLSSSVHRDNYVGPTPQSDDYWAINKVSTKEGIKFRRNVENGRSLRIEYGGFFPKINPSVEIDQNGTPIKKETET